MKINTLVQRGIGVVVAAMPIAAFAQLKNPIGVDNPSDLAGNIIRVSLGLVATIALVMIIYGGFMMLISAGNEERISQGRKTLVWAFIGLIVIFGSWGITQAIFFAVAGEPLV